MLLLSLGLVQLWARLVVSDQLGVQNHAWLVNDVQAGSQRSESWELGQASGSKRVILASPSQTDTGGQRRNEVPPAVVYQSPRVVTLPRVSHGQGVVWRQPWPGQQHHRALGDGPMGGTTSMFWWDNTDYSYVQATGLCSNYGGVLAVLSPDSSVPPNLVPEVEYWIGLFNAAQLQDQWKWIDQTTYDKATSKWAPGQPPKAAGTWCAYIAWNSTSSAWRWFAGDCSGSKGVLCGLPNSGSNGSVLPFSCVQGMSISSGSVYNSTTISDNDVSQHPQLCAALCRNDSTGCDGFRLRGTKCELQSRPAQQTVNLAVDASISVSCLRYGLDFVSVGRQVAANYLPVLASASNYKCITDYMFNMQVLETVRGVCDPSACGQLCEDRDADKGRCEAFLHSKSRCRCMLGNQPLYGTDGLVGLFSGSGYLACMRSDGTWLKLGALNDPSTVSASQGNRVFTLHPERLGYDAAATVCRTRSPAGGTLASIGSLPEALLVAIRLLLNQAPRLFMPTSSELPGMYGAWVGLSSNASRLVGLLDNTPGYTTQGVTWDDSSPVNRTLIQYLWAVYPNNSLSYKPSLDVSRTCLYFSNSTALKRPGLAAAGACSWELPFICESALTLPSPPPPPPPAPPTNMTPPVSPVALNVEAIPDVGYSNTPNVILPGQPTIMTVQDTGVLMWVQPTSDPTVAGSQATDWCRIWNASLATVYNSTAQDTLSANAEVDTSYWINLAVNQSTGAWQWGLPNTVENSTKYLTQFQSWCGGSAPPTGVGADCVQLTFSPDECSGWGWKPHSCSDLGSYMCMASPRGTPGRFFCADGYDFGGTVVGATNFTGATPKEAASYCSDLCTTQPSCHAFTVTGSVCIRRSRNATSPSSDVVRPNVTVGCFKYGLLWDMLGGQVAVQTKVAADARSRFRCIRFLDIVRTTLQQVNIASCRVSDCTAICFATRQCSVAVFDQASCQCTLGRNPLSGLDGTNSFRDGITTCIYDDEASFLGLGLARSLAYITPPADGNNPAGASGDWLGGGNNGNTQTDSGTIDDINFVPNPNNPGSPPAINPSDPNANRPQPPPVVAPPPPPTTPGNLAPPLPPRPSSSPTDNSPGQNTQPDQPSLSPEPFPFPSQPSPPPDQVNASQGGGGGPSFGVSQMIGITAGFCGGVLLVLGGICMFIIRRRKAARLHLENEKKASSSASSTSKGSPPPVSAEVTASAVRSARLSPDLERVLMSYLESSWTTSGPSGPASASGGSPRVSTTLTLSQAAELEAAIRREQSDGAMEPEEVMALEHLLQNVQAGSGNGTISADGKANGSLDGSVLHAGPGSHPRTSTEGVDHTQTSNASSNTKTHAGSNRSSIPRTAVAGGAGSPFTGNIHTATAAEAGSAMVSKSGICSSYITLSRLLGAGSFGTVYEGTWRRQTVAVKIIPHSPSAAPRVKNEVELSMQFDHPNVVRSYFYETFDARSMDHMAQLEAKTTQRESQETWIVLEYCSEGSLASRLYAQSSNHTGEEIMVPRPLHERDPCIASLAGILDIAQGVAQGMAYMHSLSICHGDLKCENVLLSKDGDMVGMSVVTAKVGDFGLSRAIGDVSSHLSTATVGTVTHMPPELLLSGRLRPSCDVYSFGIMLWQLYTGAVPYAGMRYAEIVYKVAVCNLRPVFTMDTPTAYRELAEACWHSDAAARPSFEQVIAKLAELREQVAVLDAERQRCLDPHSGYTSSGSLSSASNDITLLSPWIAACPNPGSSGIPAHASHLAHWAQDLMGQASMSAPPLPPLAERQSLLQIGGAGSDGSRPTQQPQLQLLPAAATAPKQPHVQHAESLPNTGLHLDHVHRGASTSRRATTGAGDGPRVGRNGSPTTPLLSGQAVSMAISEAVSLPQPPTQYLQQQPQQALLQYSLPPTPPLADSSNKYATSTVSLQPPHMLLATAANMVASSQAVTPTMVFPQRALTSDPMRMEGSVRPCSVLSAGASPLPTPRHASDSSMHGVVLTSNSPPSILSQESLPQPHPSSYEAAGPSTTYQLNSIETSRQKQQLPQTPAIHTSATSSPRSMSHSANLPFKPTQQWPGSTYNSPRNGSSISPLAPLVQQQHNTPLLGNGDWHHTVSGKADANQTAEPCSSLPPVPVGASSKFSQTAAGQQSVPWPAALPQKRGPPSRDSSTQALGVSPSTPPQHTPVPALNALPPMATSATSNATWARVSASGVLDQGGSAPVTVSRSASGRPRTSAVLPGGVETHITLRAHANSQVVMGMHALSLGSAHALGSNNVGSVSDTSRQASATPGGLSEWQNGGP